MKKIFGVIAVMLVLVFCSTMVFAGTAEIAVHEEGTGLLVGVGYEEDGKYQRVVDFRKGSGLRGEEATALWKTFSEIKEQLPERSYFEVVRFPEVSRYHVRFSDGHVYVAVGAGSSVTEAFSNLVANFK